MSNTFQKYLSELEIELRKIEAAIESGAENEHELIESRKKINSQIKKLHQLLAEKKSSFIIKTNKGYLTANGKYTDNENLASVYNEEEAVYFARKLGGWLENLP